ncbi:hypothetical protein QJQ45_000168 [Haematococcus lacustris]|nr:hypothetical protein QJQ45_000168 [Haematococcus lacustris]
MGTTTLLDFSVKHARVRLHQLQRVSADPLSPPSGSLWPALWGVRPPLAAGEPEVAAGEPEVAAVADGALRELELKWEASAQQVADQGAAGEREQQGRDVEVRLTEEVQGSQPPRWLDTSARAHQRPSPQMRAAQQAERQLEAHQRRGGRRPLAQPALRADTVDQLAVGVQAGQPCAKVWKELLHPTLRQEHVIVAWRVLHASLMVGALWGHILKGTAAPGSSACRFCQPGHLDTLTHAFLACPAVVPAWEWVLDVYGRLTGTRPPSGDAMLLLSGRPTRGEAPPFQPPDSLLWLRLRVAYLSTLTTAVKRAWHREYLQQRGSPAWLLLLDLAGAYGNVSWGLLQDTMEAMGSCREGHVRWSQLLHRGATSQVLLNGHLTDSFPLGSALLRGSGASPLCWCIVFQPLVSYLSSLQLAGRISTPTIPSSPLAMHRAALTPALPSKEYADDLTIVVLDRGKAGEQGLGGGLGEGGGQGQQQGGREQGGEQEPEVVIPAVRAGVPVRHLGVPLGAASYAATSEAAFGGAAAAMMAASHPWRPQGLNLLGRVQVAQQCLASKSIHQMAFVQASTPLAQAMALAVYRCVAASDLPQERSPNNNRLYSSKAICVMPRGEGGVGLPDLGVTSMAMVAKMLAQLWSPRVRPWQPLTHSLLADPSHGLSMWVITDPTAPPSRGISPRMQAHVAALAELKLFRAVPPASQSFFSVLAEPLWYNAQVRMNSVASEATAQQGWTHVRHVREALHSPQLEGEARWAADLVRACLPEPWQGMVDRLQPPQPEWECLRVGPGVGFVMRRTPMLQLCHWVGPNSRLYPLDPTGQGSLGAFWAEEGAAWAPAAVARHKKPSYRLTPGERATHLRPLPAQRHVAQEQAQGQEQGGARAVGRGGGRARGRGGGKGRGRGGGGGRGGAEGGAGGHVADPADEGPGTWPKEEWLLGPSAHVQLDPQVWGMGTTTLLDFSVKHARVRLHQLQRVSADPLSPPSGSLWPALWGVRPPRAAGEPEVAAVADGALRELELKWEASAQQVADQGAAGEREQQGRDVEVRLTEEVQGSQPPRWLDTSARAHQRPSPQMRAAQQAERQLEAHQRRGGRRSLAQPALRADTVDQLAVGVQAGQPCAKVWKELLDPTLRREHVIVAWRVLHASLMVGALWGHILKALVLIALQLNYRCFGLGSRRTQAHSSLMSSSNPTYRVDYERFHGLGTTPQGPGLQGPGTTPQGPGTSPQGPGTSPQGPGPQGPGTTPQSPGTTPQGPGTTPQGPGTTGYLHAHTNELEDMQPCEQPSTLPEPDMYAPHAGLLPHTRYPHAHNSEPEDMQPCEQPSTLPEPDMYAPHAGLLPHTRYPHAHNSEPEDAQPCEQPSTRPGPATLAPHAGLLPCTRYPYAHTNNPEDEQPCDQLSTLPRPAKYTPHADPLPCTRYPHANTKETEDEQLGEQPNMRPGPAMHAGMPPRTRYPHAYTNETEDEQPCAQPSMLPGPAVYAPHAGMPPRSRYPHAHTNGVKDEQPYEVIEMYLRIHYGLAVQSIAQLNQPSDWSADNLGNLAGQYGTHTFLCKKPGHSMAMKCIDGAWNLLDFMETTPTPLSHIPTATMRTMHQLFVITPNTRSREQMRMCAKRDIHHIISHVEQTGHGHDATAIDPAYPEVTARNLDPSYMERQYDECCLVHAFNMAMGKKCIDYHAVISHCKQLAEHLQHLAQEARAAGHTIQTLKTDHIYHAKGKFSSDTLNHYLHRKHHEMHMYLHPASIYLPTQSITLETITNAITSTGATHTEAVILLSHQHATAIKHTPHGWHLLDSFNRVPKPLSTPNDWSSLHGNILTICTGDVRHTRFIRREIWIADPLEATTPSALAAHFRDHLDPIDLTTDHTEARETPGPLHVTTTTAETSCTTDSTRRATAEGIPPHDEPTRLRQRRDTPTVTLRPQTTTRIHRPTTPLDNATDVAKKRVRVTKRHGNDTHTQTLMFKYLCKPTAKTHNIGPVSTIDEAPKSTPDIDLGTNQHHSPPPPPTPNRQHITLTTFNVRGLHRSRNEVLNLVHSQSPDILILTETMTQPRSNNPSSGWLKRVMPNYTVHRHQGHNEVLIGIRHDLAIPMQATMIQPCTDADVNTRCVILSLRQRQSEELTLVATYWPSGNNDDALPIRKKVQEYIRTATGHLPGSLILAGDINATMKTEDRSEHTEYTQDTMMRKFATEMRLSEADSGDRAWTYQQPHCNSRIDAILTRDARHGPEHCTHVDTNAYLSDHRPLTATLSTARLGIDLSAPQKPQKHSHTILTTPITNKDREAYRLAVQQPSSGAPQLHAHVTAYLAPMYTDAIHFLTTIDKANPQQPQRLTLVAGLPAREAVDTAATMLTTLLQTCRTTAIKTCNTKTLTRGGQHYQRRTMCKIRQALGKKLKTTRELSRKARVFFKQNNVHPTIDELIPETDTTNAETREAVQARQGDDTTENHVQAALAQLTNSYRDQIHKLDDDDSALAIAQARVRMQQLISTQPKKANKYILRPSRTDHKGLQALADPITNKICTAPADLNRIITDAYGTKLAPPTPKTGNYTNTQTRNYPWARAKADDPFTMHTCQNVHWLHTAIMDKAGFQKCLSRLSGGKAPGPDGIENEIIKMLPWEMRDTIHQLFIIMWATGCTPTTWKTSDTCLLYKDKGQETDLNSYRPVGLANTVYKLWTSLITKILTECAEANGMLSKNQAGFRSHRNTTQQLQMLVMALEVAKLAKADIYALLVDFTSAFNTTCQDKLLWIMHDLGFPTDATDAVKDLYTGATTRFRTPYGPTNPVPVDRGTIMGDSLSPFLFLIYIEPLLRWLQVGARGYKFKSATVDSGERAIVSSIDYADDIAILCNTLRNLRCQADKLSAFSDWGHLVISHSKTLATAALHHSVETGMCSNAAEADKRARQQLQTVSLQGKPVTYHRPTSPFTYLGVLITMTLDEKPQHTAMITQLRQKLERLKRSFASARQAIHIIRTAIIPSLAYSLCAVPCTPGDLELYDRSINQCVKLKLRLPLGTPNAIVREDAGKLGMGISSTAQEYHARNTTALTQSLQSTDVTHAHISRSMLHKQITWLNTQANTQGHRMLTLFHHTLRARQLVYTSLAGLSATEGGLPLYPEECHTLGRLITQANSSHAHDVVNASITCLKSLGITHACELSCEGNTHIITGSMLTSKYGKKVKQKHIIALNKLAAMAAQPSCPDATATRTIRDSRNTSLTLPPDQRKITPWAAGLTDLAPTSAVPDTRTRYMDMKAYAVMHATQPDTTERAGAAPAAQAAIKSSSRLLQREQRATPSNPLQPTRLKAAGAIIEAAAWSGSQEQQPRAAVKSGKATGKAAAAMSSHEQPPKATRRSSQEFRLRKAKEFLVKWKGYEDSDNTWEPANNLANAPDCVNLYKAQHGLL